MTDGVRRPHRYYTTLELRRMREWAERGFSQPQVARFLDRHPGSVAVTAIRYGIKFNGYRGRPIEDLSGFDKRRRQKIEGMRRLRARRRAAS